LADKSATTDMIRKLDIDKCVVYDIFELVRYIEWDFYDFMNCYSQYRNISILSVGGNYDNWNEAMKQCRGYAHGNVLDSVVKGVKAVLSGEAIYERDSVVFFDKSYEHHILSYIFQSFIASGKKEFTVLDWGGGMASIYLQHRDIFVKYIPNMRWVIVEQSEFVSQAAKLPFDEHVEFIDANASNLESILVNKQIDFILIRGSLQCIENYQDVIHICKHLNAKHILIDRIVIGDQERICIRYAPKQIYDMETPVRIFEKEKLLADFTGYHLVEERKVNTQILLDNITRVTQMFFALEIMAP
jgi:putative methyltransferase (TIGR04325 family)